MSKRTFVRTAFAFLAFVAATGALCAAFGFDRISLSESDLQASLNQQLPKTIERLTIEQVNVRIADDRLVLRIDLQGPVLNQLISASVAARGSPRYAARTGELFFDPDDIKFISLAVGNKTVIGETKAAEGPEAASSAVQRLVETAIKLFLATQPVYRFKNDFVGVVAKMTLAGIAVERDKLVITLSIWSLTAAAMIAGLIVLVASYLAYLFIRYPPWLQRKRI